MVQPPTRNREDLIAAIDRFQLQRATAIGSGILVSLATIFPDAGIDVAHVRSTAPPDARAAGRSTSRSSAGQGSAQAGAARLLQRRR